MTHRTTAALLVLAAATSLAAAPPLRSESFDADPHWESHNNRVTPATRPVVTQDFGYAPTNVAGRAAGELAGRITRAARPAYYADAIPPLTLKDKFSASGTFALTATTGGAGCFLGFFRADQPELSGRPVGSLGLDLDTEQGGGRLAVRLITADNSSTGTFVTPYLPGKFRPTPLRRDGTRYAFTLDYDPHANNAHGRITFTLRAQVREDDPLLEKNLKGDLPAAHRAEALARFPNTTAYTIDLPIGFKATATMFDRFGVANMTKPGGHLTLHVDDLKYLGRTQDFSADPKWAAKGNRETYTSAYVVGAHDFGYSAKTNHAGGKSPGEIGGDFWRTERWGYYATKVDPLSFDQRIEARGKVVLATGGVDADMAFGFFAIRDKDSSDDPSQSGPFLGIKVGGPTRIGHMFKPALMVTKGVGARPESAPVMPTGGRPCDFSFTYDPDANDGHGAITATLNDGTVTHNLKPGVRAKAKAVRLDRFGVFTISTGGQVVRLYLDDLEFTAAPRP